MPAAQRRRPRWASLLPLALLASALTSCASFESDRHVAPLFTRVSRAGGGDRTEALGGIVIVEHAQPDRPYTAWGVRPLFIHDRLPEERASTDFLYPLGTIRREPRSLLWQILPLARYSRVEDEEGERWSFLSLLGLYFAGFPDGRRVRAWFPVAGIVEGNLTFERLEWVLFPLYARSVRQGRATYHVLWPVFAYGRDEHSGAWRVWPLVGRSWRAGSYDRRYALWPIFQHQRSNLKAREELQRRDWMVFPLYGHTAQGSYRSHTLLWPFFGHAHDERSGFWAWDGPWPLVRVSRPGSGAGPYRTRFWPFFGHYRGDGLDQRYYGWPLFVRRKDEFPRGRVRAYNLVPFWQWSERYDSDPEADPDPVRWRKLWPLYRRYEHGGGGRMALVSLDPLWNLPTFDRHYAWLWEAYSREWEPQVVRERSWLGLWRRERDADEARHYVTGLWSSRRYSQAGRAVTDRSLLFGLLRWRSTAGSLRLLAPALPGPGWPLERLPSSLPGSEAASSPTPSSPTSPVPPSAPR